jgi:hypothetical protein
MESRGVNGTVTLKDGAMTSERLGEVLRRTACG